MKSYILLNLLPPLNFLPQNVRALVYFYKYNYGSVIRELELYISINIIITYFNSKREPFSSLQLARERQITIEVKQNKSINANQGSTSTVNYMY